MYSRKLVIEQLIFNGNSNIFVYIWCIQQKLGTSFFFQTRYNKRKRGPYREAIKQATCEAEQILSHDFDFQDREEEQQQQQHQTPENLLGASPREVDVVS